jgi:enoyl-CoA hydratase/carnithine racemase
VAPEELEGAARDLANRLAARDPEAVRATKRAVRDGLDLSLEAGLALERRLAFSRLAG